MLHQDVNIGRRLGSCLHKYLAIGSPGHHRTRHPLCPSTLVTIFPDTMSELYSSVTPGSWCYDHNGSKCPPLELDAFAYPYPNIPEEWCATLLSDEVLAAQGHLSGQSPPTTFGHPFDVVDYNDVTLYVPLRVSQSLIPKFLTLCIAWPIFNS